MKVYGQSIVAMAPPSIHPGMHWWGFDHLVVNKPTHVGKNPHSTVTVFEMELRDLANCIKLN